VSFPIILISYNADKVCLMIERVQFLLVPRDKITKSDEFQVRAVLKSERNSLRPGFGSFVNPYLFLICYLCQRMRRYNGVDVQRVGKQSNHEQNEEQTMYDSGMELK